jgi:hypothetical protein
MAPRGRYPTGLFVESPPIGGAGWMIATFVIDQVRWVGRDRAQHDLVGHLHLAALCPILWGGKIAGGRRLHSPAGVLEERRFPWFSDVLRGAHHRTRRCRRRQRPVPMPSRPKMAGIIRASVRKDIGGPRVPGVKVIKAFSSQTRGCCRRSARPGRCCGSARCARSGSTRRPGAARFYRPSASGTSLTSPRSATRRGFAPPTRRRSPNFGPRLASAAALPCRSVSCPRSPSASACP